MIVDADQEVRRGRPRNESCTTEILTATLELVAEIGHGALTMDAVAAKAGVGKATIYRRWSSKEALMLDAWTSCVQAPTVPDTGNVRDDLRVFLRGVDSGVRNRELQRVYPQLIAAARVNPEVGARYQEFITQRRAPMRALLERALARGEIRADTDLDVLHELLIAPMVYRWMITDSPVDGDFIDRLVLAVLRGAQAEPLTQG
ncbi:MAG: hypothetical protein RJA49_2624 [Actinomycetota bacterium]